MAAEGHPDTIGKSNLTHSKILKIYSSVLLEGMLIYMLEHGTVEAFGVGSALGKSLNAHYSLEGESSVQLNQDLRCKNMEDSRKSTTPSVYCSNLRMESDRCRFIAIK